MIDSSNTYKSHLIDSRLINLIQKCKQNILRTIALIALPIIFCLATLYATLIKLHALHLTAILVVPILGIEALILVSGCLFIAAIISQIIVVRKAKSISLDKEQWKKQMQAAHVDPKIIASCIFLASEDQCNGNYDFTHATYFAKQKRLEQEKEIVYQDNCTIINHFCSHIFKFTDPRLNALLRESCKLEAHQWNEVLANYWSNVFERIFYADPKTPALVTKLQIKLQKQLYLSKRIKQLLKDKVDPTFIVQALNWLFYTPKPIPWDQLDLNKTKQSITLTHLPTNLIQNIEIKDIEEAIQKIIYSVNQKNYPQAKAYALSEINKIQDPDLLAHLKPKLLEIEQKLKKLFQSNSTIVDLEKQREVYDYMIKSSREIYYDLIRINKIGKSLGMHPI